MKKFLAIILAFVMVLSFTACKGKEKEEEKEKDALKVGLAMNDMDASQVLYLAVFQRLAEQDGIELVYTNAGGKVDTQISDVESLLVQGIDILVIEALDAVALADIADTAADTGIPVVDLFYGIKSDKVIHVSGADPFYRGEYITTIAIPFLEKDPDLVLNVGYIWGSMSTDTSRMMYNASIDAINARPDLKGRFNILDEQDGNWSAETAMNITENWLQSYPEMNCIVTMADQLAVGAVSAIQGAGGDFNEWYVFGNDLKADAAQMIVDGQIRGSLYADFEETLSFAWDCIKKAVAGELKAGDKVSMGNAYTPVYAEKAKELLDAGAVAGQQ